MQQYSITPVVPHGSNTVEYIVKDLPPMPKIEAKEHIRVIVRVRPFNNTELSRRRERRAVHCMNDYENIQLTSEDGRLTPMKFNRVFDELATQEQVFQQCGVTQLVSRALEG
ncbi:MAG: hypothetical protein SGCHY_001365, partial [Lobulomycetales sp.]